jgi:hypothetical protein
MQGRRSTDIRVGTVRSSSAGSSAKPAGRQRLHDVVSSVPMSSHPGTRRCRPRPGGGGSKRGKMAPFQAIQAGQPGEEILPEPQLVFPAQLPSRTTG